ncbi:MAG: hypothetical protein R3E86_06425 [Pseudomonadales bacterium]
MSAPSVEIGDLTLTADSSGVSFVLAQSAQGRAKISPRQVRLLEEFLKQHAPHERRIGFRVPFGPLKEEVRSGFQVQARVRGAWIDLQGVDLSLTGILVEGRGMAVPVHCEVPMRLCFQGLECSLRAEVVRRNQTLTALHFVDSLRNGDLNPPEDLLSIYRRLEMEWLRSRLV